MADPGDRDADLEIPVDAADAADRPDASDASALPDTGEPPARPRRRDLTRRQRRALWRSKRRQQEDRHEGGKGRDDAEQPPEPDSELEGGRASEPPASSAPIWPTASRSGQDRPPGDGSTQRPRRSERRAEIRQQRRRARTRLVVAGALVLLVAATAIAVAALWSERTGEVVAPTDVAPDSAAIASGDRQPSLALVTYDDASGDAASASIVVLAYDREMDQGTVLLVPGGTVADVPGHGSFTVGDAYTFGEGPLVAVTVDNLLDVRLDGVVSISRSGWASLAEALGPLAVDVRSRLVSSAAGTSGEVRFEPGSHQLEGDRLAEYVTFQAEGETELEALPRTQQVIAALLERVAEDPGALADSLGLDASGTGGLVTDAVEDSGPLQTSDPQLTYALLTELADASRRERVTTLTLPVSPLGSGRDDLYRIDAPRAGQLIDERLSASRPTGTTGAGRTLQVLNGNGIPGIGQQVAERLQPGGYRTLLTGNADRFTHETTRIVIYDDSAEQLAVAQDIRERLGVGEIERSGTPQSVVDVTIVVGADFPPA